MVVRAVMMQRLWKVVKAPLQAGLITASGDTCCQMQLEGKSFRDLDKRRTLAFATFGFFYGKWFRGAGSCFCRCPVLLCTMLLCIVVTRFVLVFRVRLQPYDATPTNTQHLLTRTHARHLLPASHTHTCTVPYTTCAQVGS